MYTRISSIWKSSVLFVAIPLLFACQGSKNAVVQVPAATFPGFGRAEMAEPGSVPHYFGPYPNWANSPLRLADAVVEFDGGGGSGAAAVAKVDAATGAVFAVEVSAPGSGYTSAPRVKITSTSGTGKGASAKAVVDAAAGTLKSVALISGGTGYLTPGIRKFVDTLPGLGPSAANNLGQYIPVAVPADTYPGSDYYEIAVVQYQEKLHSDLQPTTLRGYVQLSTVAVPGRRVPLKYPDGSPILLPNGDPALAVDDPHYLGPFIVATKDRPVRILFRNLLPVGVGGDLFLPVDTTLMGAGRGPLGDMNGEDPQRPACGSVPKPAECFKENRATLHLHGGATPWISDGTPHQWVTPANETTPYPKGVSVQNVPDMPDPGPGAMTFFYTNQQSARLMFYHDHAWGITRLNVYAGEEAGYLITDATEQRLVTQGLIPADQIPLIIQDRTFVPGVAQLAAQDPTWDAGRWGNTGTFWYHHVYMSAQNPGDPSGMSAFGRWMYGPWFWPPATPVHGPIQNPYFDPSCRLDDPSTWQYQSDPFCEPQLVPGAPYLSAGMEQFNDTPLVNGTAYPSVTLAPKPYRFRVLNAANDRFWNLQWYLADASGTEVALSAAELRAAQDDPSVFPTPDVKRSPPGPSWIQIGTEGGFLAAPAVIQSQPITWISDQTRFDFGNVDQHALLVAPAERADVIVDFSRFAGKTLILYNDAPAAFPARVPSYDYYTGAPDLSPVGVPKIAPGFGPNTRTIMQVKIAAGKPHAFDLAALQAAFAHKEDGSGVFESGQHPIVVGQAAYNSAYGTHFAESGWCSSPSATFPCDGFARISQQGGLPFTFDSLSGVKLSIPFQPKAIHDEMNSTSFDEYGRMQANLGVEVVPADPGGQNVVLLPYTLPATEIIDASSLPTTLNLTPIASNADGTQIWKITHNGVDTHPVHFHASDVQVVNRVTWDNIVMPPEPNELGWKDTVRVSPLQDTIVAIRPVLPVLPFDVPNSVRLLSPALPENAMVLGSATASNPAGVAVDVTNHLVNFGAEYVWHCHMLSHEEMDMMRTVSIAMPPRAPSGLAFESTTLTWNDNSVNETAFAIETSADGSTWTEVDRVDRTGDAGSTTGPMVRALVPVSGLRYRVSALNTVGDAATPGFPTMTVRSVSEAIVAP